MLVKKVKINSQQANLTIKSFRCEYDEICSTSPTYFGEERDMADDPYHGVSERQGRRWGETENILSFSWLWRFLSPEIRDAFRGGGREGGSVRFVTSSLGQTGDRIPSCWDAMR